jgi:hypothetical protein
VLAVVEPGDFARSCVTGPSGSARSPLPVKRSVMPTAAPCSSSATRTAAAPGDTTSIFAARAPSASVTHGSDASGCTCMSAGAMRGNPTASEDLVMRPFRATCDALRARSAARSPGDGSGSTTRRAGNAAVSAMRAGAARKAAGAR